LPQTSPTGEADDDLVAEVLTSADTRRALARLAEALQHRGWSIDRASLRHLDFQEGYAVLVSLWCPLGTSLIEGTRFPLSSTAYPVILSTGRPVRMGRDPYPPLPDQILEREGIRAWITIPLWNGPTIAGLLSLAAIAPDAFPRDSVPFFEQLGSKVQEHLLALLKSEVEPEEGSA
jgi:GAF domain